MPRRIPTGDLLAYYLLSPVTCSLIDLSTHPPLLYVDLTGYDIGPLESRLLDTSAAPVTLPATQISTNDAAFLERNLLCYSWLFYVVYELEPARQFLDIDMN